MRLRVKLLPNWIDASADNPDGPPTYIRSSSTDSGAFQVSWSEYTGGEIPNPSAEVLQTMAEDFGRQKGLGELVSGYQGTCDFGIFGTSAFKKADGSWFQLWMISDGRNFIQATHITHGEPDLEEIKEADQIARMLSLTAAS